MPRPVSYTIQDPVASDVKQLVFGRNDQGQVLLNASYELRDELGNVVVRSSVVLALTGPQITSLGSFINSVVVPEIIESENL